MGKVQAGSLKKGDHVEFGGHVVGPIEVRTPGRAPFGQGPPDPQRVLISGKTADGRPISVTRRVDEMVEKVDA